MFFGRTVLTACVLKILAAQPFSPGGEPTENQPQSRSDQLKELGAKVSPDGDRLMVRAGCQPVPAGLIRQIHRAKAEVLQAISPARVEARFWQHRLKAFHEKGMPYLKTMPVDLMLPAAARVVLMLATTRFASIRRVWIILW